MRDSTYDAGSSYDEPAEWTTRGGWSPRAVAGLDIELTPQQSLACALRILARVGFSENLAGHITVVQDGTTNLWANPWGLWWSETRASDICLIDESGRVIDGKWDVTPAIFIHTELHRSRSSARVVVHNHPYYVRVLAAMTMLPLALHQTVSLYHQDMCLIDEYDGEVGDPDAGKTLAERIGDHEIALLANHGVLISGATIEEAVYRSANFEDACRLTLDALASGRPVREIDPAAQEAIKKSLLTRAVDVFWAGSVRQLLRQEPDVLQ